MQCPRWMTLSWVMLLSSIVLLSCLSGQAYGWTTLANDEQTILRNWYNGLSSGDKSALNYDTNLDFCDPASVGTSIQCDRSTGEVLVIAVGVPYVEYDYGYENVDNGYFGEPTFFMLSNIPTTFAGLTGLQIFGWSQNNIGSSIPTQLFSLTQLQQLYLYGPYNQSLPTEIGALSSLSSLSYTTLGVVSSISIPTQISSLANLQSISYSSPSSNFGAIPDLSASGASLVNVRFNGNGHNNASLDSLIYISNHWGNLQYITVTNLGIATPFPVGFLGDGTGGLNLQQLVVSYNNLYGPIPLQVMTAGVTIDMTSNPNLCLVFGEDMMAMGEFTLSYDERLSTCNTGSASVSEQSVLDTWYAALGSDDKSSLGWDTQIDLCVYEILGDNIACNDRYEVEMLNFELEAGFPPSFVEMVNLTMFTYIQTQPGVLATGAFAGWAQSMTLLTLMGIYDAPMPTEIGLLENLEILNFINFNPTISSPYLPSQLESLTNLGTIDIEYPNSPMKSIPNLSASTGLESIILVGNGEGAEQPYPDWLVSMTSLSHLALKGLALTGTIPTTLFPPQDSDLYPTIAYISLHNNNLVGPIPTQITASGVTTIDLTGNPGLCLLGGVSVGPPGGGTLSYDDDLPACGTSELANTEATILVTWFNSLSASDKTLLKWNTNDSTPAAICNGTFQNNGAARLTCSGYNSELIEFHTTVPLMANIPASFAGLTSMQIFNYTQNITVLGVIPSEIFRGMMNLQAFYYTGSITDPLPSTISAPPYLSTFSFTNTYMTSDGNGGPAMQFCIGVMPALQTLVYESCSKIGELIDFTELTTLQALTVGVNVNCTAMYGQQTGDFTYTSEDDQPFPTSLLNLTELTSISFVNMDLTGTIPTEIFAITALTELNLSFNQFAGTIPTEISTSEVMLAIFTSNPDLCAGDGVLPQMPQNGDDRGVLQVNNTLLNCSYCTPDFDPVITLTTYTTYVAATATITVTTTVDTGPAITTTVYTTATPTATGTATPTSTPTPTPLCDQLTGYFKEQRCCRGR